MAKARLICAMPLAPPLLIFGGNYFVQLSKIPPPPSETSGMNLLQAIRDGGLMMPIAASQVLIGVLLLVPRLRFAGSVLPLPVSIGILAFHITMLPEGNAVAAVMLLLKPVVLTDRSRVAALLDTC